MMVAVMMELHTYLIATVTIYRFKLDKSTL